MNKKVIVVTGGSRGIGRAVCEIFAGPSTIIYFNYSSSPESAAETEKLVVSKGGTAKSFRVNIQSGQEVQSFFSTIIDEEDRIDILVNNAGISRDGLLVRMKETDWDSVLDTNLKGTFFCSKAAAKQMMKQRYGRIINITSLVGVTGNPGQVNYVASKAGIIGLTKAAARELAPRNITVNAVAPGFIETDMTDALPDTVKEKILSEIPLKRAGTPSDVAEVVSFLASDGASYITGQTIHVSGGMYT
jgi:3-oxoacyl-[acyl-carrier protein] reductase